MKVSWSAKQNKKVRNFLKHFSEREGEKVGVSFLFQMMSVFSNQDSPVPTTTSPIVTVHINVIVTKFLVDTSARVKILDNIDYDNMCSKLEFQKDSVRIYAYGSTQTLLIYWILQSRDLV